MKASSFASIALATVFLFCLASFALAATPTVVPSPPYPIFMHDGERNFPTSSIDTETSGKYVKVEAGLCKEAFWLADGAKTSVFYYITEGKGKAKPGDKIFYQDPKTGYYKYTTSTQFNYVCFKTKIRMSMDRADRYFPTNATDTATYGYYVVLKSTCKNSFITPTPKKDTTESIYYIYDKARGAAKVGRKFYQKKTTAYYAYFDATKFEVRCFMWPFQEIARASEAFEQSLEAFPETALVPAESIEGIGDENVAYGVIAGGVLIGLAGFAFMKKRWAG